MAQRTITLTDRPPVRINEDNWPTLASASEHWYDSEYESQANRESKRAVVVRRSAKNPNRAIVYATYWFRSAWVSEQGAQCRRGVVIDDAGDADRLARQIRAVCDSMDDPSSHDGDETTWAQMADECIADLPPVVLD